MDGNHKCFIAIECFCHLYDCADVWTRPSKYHRPTRIQDYFRKGRKDDYSRVFVIIYTTVIRIWFHSMVLFLVFFLVLAFLSIRHNYFSVNIVLELMCYRFYSCELENEDGVSISKIVVCKGSLSAQIGSAILARAINNDYIVKLSDKRKIWKAEWLVNAYIT